MNVVFRDQGSMFNDPFRFLPYCPHCNAEISAQESPCHKCNQVIEWPDAAPANVMPISPAAFVYRVPF